MANHLSHEAAIPNPALEPMTKFIGEWKSTGTHPYVPGTLHGRASFKWIEGGAFVVMHTEVEEQGIPSGISIFGSDNATGKYYMFYFDERKVSRMYDASLEDNALKFWRNGPEFSQRYAWTVSGDGKTITGKGEICKDGSTWEADLNQTFSRLD